MAIAYLDCFSGISGDMFVGALLDAGLSLEDLRKGLESLDVEGYRLEARQEARHRISGARFLVRVDEERQVPRDFRDIRRMILEGRLDDAVKDKCIRIFEALAEVEGRIHNVPTEEVHFHEVGAVDSIIDIVGSVYGLHKLGITSLYVSPLPLGSGFVETAHGRIPVPAPATVGLLKDVPVYDSGVPHEMVTPTGAALVKGLAAFFGPIPPMVVKKVGYGVGKRELADRPNLLRILVGEGQFEGDSDTVALLETNLDDTNPEWLGYLMERLLDEGALDVVFCPLHMKKGRPGVQVQVMGRPDQKDRLMEILFRETTTLGIRFRYSQRKVLERSEERVESPWGEIKVKKVIGQDGLPLLLPEYEACRDIASREGIALRKVFYWIMGLNKDRSGEG